MKRRLVLAVFSLSLALSAWAGAAEPRWELLGRKEVNFKGDRDHIDVGKKEGKFRQIQIRVDGAPVEIQNMKVTFGNDETFSPELKYRFDESSKSRIIDLPGERRTIKQVVFHYHSPNRREGKATVAVYAR
jgi:hypothetical protein